MFTSMIFGLVVGVFLPTLLFAPNSNGKGPFSCIFQIQNSHSYNYKRIKYFCTVNVNSMVVICTLSSAHWQQASKVHCLTALRAHSSMIEALIIVIIMTGDVAQWLERRNSNPKTLGSISWRGRVSSRFSVPPSKSLLQTCLCKTLLHVYGTHPHVCAS